MPNNLMVLQDAWHWRKANYWDMPKCATCEHHKPKATWCGVLQRYIDPSFGCVYHSSIAMPVLLHTHTEPTE